MRVRMLVSSLVAATLVATPALANPAAKLSVKAGSVRASTSTEAANRQEGGDSTAYIVGGVLLAGGILAVALSSGDPDSP